MGTQFKLKESNNSQPNKIIYFYLEQEGKDINIMIENEEGDTDILGYLNPDNGLVLYSGLPKEYALPLDEDGFIKIEKI
jgi:hypothetical protein